MAVFSVSGVAVNAPNDIFYTIDVKLGNADLVGGHKATPGTVGWNGTSTCIAYNSTSGAVGDIEMSSASGICFDLGNDNSGNPTAGLSVGDVFTVFDAEYPLNGTYRVSEISGSYYCTNDEWLPACHGGATDFGWWQTCSGAGEIDPDAYNLVGVNVGCNPSFRGGASITNITSFDGLILWHDNCLEILGCQPDKCTDLTTAVVFSGDHSRIHQAYTYCLGSFIGSATSADGARSVKDG